jgi:hypothetical protein
MNSLQRVGDGTIQIWRALPTWGKVVAVIVGMIGLYYSFAIIVGLFVLAALGVGIVTILSWMLRK